jgi:hypothetical protein
MSVAIYTCANVHDADKQASFGILMLLNLLIDFFVNLPTYI